jgi:hypothetical protein
VSAVFTYGYEYIVGYFNTKAMEILCIVSKGLTGFDRIQDDNNGTQGSYLSCQSFAGEDINNSFGADVEPVRVRDNDISHQIVAFQVVENCSRRTVVHIPPLLERLKHLGTTVVDEIGVMPATQVSTSRMQSSEVPQSTHAFSLNSGLKITVGGDPQSLVIRSNVPMYFALAWLIGIN